MSKRFPTQAQPVKGPRKLTLDNRISQLRAKKPSYISRGEELLLQGVAASSLRAQRILDGKFNLD